MSLDGVAPLYQAAVHPRQILSTVTQSTSATLSHATTSVKTTVSAVAAIGYAFLPDEVFTTLTEETTLDDRYCTAALPQGGMIQINDTFALVLKESVSIVAQCGNHSIFQENCTGNNATVIPDPDDHFYASITPQVYALATATIVSYMLLILIFITPRTFYVGGPGAAAITAGTAAGLRTFLPGSGGRNSSVIGIGRRPLLQKIAALTVAISLTIATADTFRVAERQFGSGFIQSRKLVEEVVGSLEIRITRVISDTFLWLAQVQTLIRLFPRHKEKVTIKWLGFGLVLCDTVFSILENFMNQQSYKNSINPRPTRSTDAIPALSYLFELSISLIYASCVIYYALSKRRFAFWHAKMRNVFLVAILSIVAVLIPVVFFITDLASSDIATWGEYIRWVGAAAASVVVWEWVERIEALERDEKKDGILGREIFDGDEMLDMNQSDDGHGGNRTVKSKPNTKKKSKFWKNVRDLHVDMPQGIPQQLRKWRKDRTDSNDEKNVTTVENTAAKNDTGQGITRPPQAVTPISRSDTNSATSTVYAVRYHDPFSPSPAIPEELPATERRQSVPINVLPAISDDSTLTNSTNNTMDQRKASQVESIQAVSSGRQIWQGVANPFKRKRTEPPAEVAAQIAETNARRSPLNTHLNLRGRFNAFTSAQKGKLGGRPQKSRTPLAITVIPAQPRASRANMEIPATEPVSGSKPESEQEDSSSSEDETSPTVENPVVASPDLATLPVTFIPPPVRGGRTWSPDDLAHIAGNTPPAQDGISPNFQFGEQPASFAAGTASQPTVIQSQRGALTISESPGRVRDNGTPSTGSSSAIRRSRNNRSATLSSISDRLSSASPTATSGSSGTRSATTDSTRPAQPDEHRPPNGDDGQPHDHR